MRHPLVLAGKDFPPGMHRPIDQKFINFAVLGKLERTGYCVVFFRL